MAIERSGDPRRAEISRLRRLALRDELTGLANRRAFLQRLRDEMSRARRHGAPFSLVLLDLDGLKDLNDTFGHQAGDAALKHFARALARAVRQEDLVSRIGGDEFAVIAVHGSAAEAKPFAERIRRVAAGLARRVMPRSQPVWLSAAWGAAVWDPEVTEAETLFARAESALIAAKQSTTATIAGVSGVYQPRGRRALGEELRRLLAMARDVSSARELQVLCRAAAEQAASLVGARMASVALRASDGRTGYTERYADGAWHTADEWYGDGHGLIGHVMESAEPVVVNDLRSDPYADQAAVQRFGARNTMCLPLRAAAGRAVGVLALTNKRDDRGFTGADVELGLAFADLVASAIDNVRAREAVEEANSYLLSLMDQAHDAIYITHPVSRRILDTNAAAESMYGYSRAELLTMQASDLRVVEDRLGPGTTDMALAADGGLTVPRRHRRKDGSTILVEVSVRVVSTPRGDVVMNIIRDVSARVAAEEALRRRNLELQARNDVAALLAGADDPATSLARTLQTIVETLGADGGVVVEYDPESGTPGIAADFNVPEPLRSYLHSSYLHPRSFSLGDGLMGAALAGQPVVIEDAERDPRVRREETRAAGVRSLGIVPMRAHGEVVGVIAVGSFAPQRFGTAELGLLQAVADQIGLWTENRRLLARSRQREQDARFLADLGDELNRARDVSRVVRLLTRKAGGALGRASLVLLRDAETGEWEVAHIYHPSRAQRDRIAALMAAHPPRASGGLTDLASRSAGPMLLDVANAGLPDNLTLRLRQIGVTSIVFAPLRMGDRMLGMFISAAASGMPPLTERHRLLAAEISRHASVALANAIARRELLARNRELALMNRVTSVAQRATTAAGLCADIIRCLHRAFPGRGAVLRTWDAEAGVLRLAAAAGFSDEIVAELAEHPPRLGERLAGHVAATREPKLTQSLTADPRLAFDGPVIPTFRALMAAPLLIEGRLVGTVSMVSDHAGAFTASHLRLLSSVAGPLAAAMARLAAYERAEGAGRYSRALIDNAADAVFVVDPRTHRVVDTNPAAERLTGYSRTELLALCDQELRPPAEREQPSSSDLAVRHGRFTNRRPALVRRKDGTDVPIEVSASMVDSPAGLVALNIVRDITERTAGEARLRFQSQVLAAMRDAVVATDLSRRAVFWNEGATQLYGWTAEEMLGQPLDRLVPPGEEVSHEENFRRAASGEVWQAERQRLRKDGTLIWCDMRFSPLFDDRGEVSGVLAVLRDVTDRRQAEEAIGRARDEAARRAAEFAATAEASRAVVGGGSPHTQLQRLTTHIGHVTAFDAVLVVVYDHHADEVRFESAFHRPEHPPAALLGRIGERRPGWQSVEFQRLIAMRAPEVVEDVASAPPEVVAKDHWARTDRFRTLVRVPLYYNGRAEGCFLLASRRLVPVTGDDLHLYQTLADPVSVAVHNLIEYDRALEMRRDAIFRLATACEARDPETMPHLLQMQHLTASLARELGMTEEEVEDHSLSSVLHDAGKIRTPDTILWKPGKLGPEEMVIVRLHAAHGEQLLAGPEFYATARSVARHHHERWDGSGYPDGLAGDDIPLAARIAAVADVFDSMTSRRVYRPAWPAERAADEIIAHAGRMFDPRVVEAFASLLRSDRLPVRPSARV